MRRLRRHPLLCALLLTCLALPGRPLPAQLSERFQAMNQPAEPFRIYGNLYSVGASSVTVFLITTPEGHILIDGGFEETVPMIRANLEKLGFRLEDVKVLLNSHAHFDHAGGLAALRQLTGARVVASRLDADQLERGGRGDDVLGDEGAFAPVQVDRRLEDGEVVELGGMRLTARLTPGHTRGCTSWDFEVREGEETARAVSICSLTILDGVRLEATKDGRPPTYPGIADDFRRSFEVLEALPCDLFLASHAEFFQQETKRARLGGEGPNPFLDREGYLAYVQRARQRFEEVLAAGR